MHLRRLLCPAIKAASFFCLTILSLAAASASNQSCSSFDTAPGALFSSNGFTDVVQWDNYSLAVKGQRIFLHSGEFHTFRLPVPGLWLDILQKVKAAGLNGVSVYVHWGLINPSPGVVDFAGYRSLQPLFDAAKAAGVWVVLRPGPYINAETTAGGIAHWVTSQVAGDLRSAAADYQSSWQDYISGIINATRANQITEGGPVIAIQIDNEVRSAIPQYFVELEDAYRNSGIVVPLTYNDPGQRKNFVNGTGAVDIYGLDSYPQGFDCSHPTQWSSVPTNYHDYHEGTSPSEPFYIPEFQGGAFDPWGPNAPGYLACQQLTGSDFQDVFYKALWADNVRMLNFYMIYGGTSWGALPFPGVYTSYDYGSTIAENRMLTAKYAELKRQGLFIRSSPEFYKTDWMGNSSSTAVTVSNSAAFVTFLSNPDTGAGFYVGRQSDATSTGTIDFSLEVSTSNGTLSVPQMVSSITLSGRQAKVIATDYLFGGSRALYTTASVLFAGKIGSRDVLFLFGDSSQEHEAAIPLLGKAGVRTTSSAFSFTTPTGNSTMTIISIQSGVQGLVTVWDSDSQLILFSDTDTAGTFFAPVIPSTAASGDAATFKNYWQFGSNSTVLVGGPYLVRNATLSGSSLNLRGDLNASAQLTVIAPQEVTRVTWNGRAISTNPRAGRALTKFGGIIGQVETRLSPSSTQIPKLTNWKFADSLPETQSDFTDENWIEANHTTTNIPDVPAYGDGRILYSCDYGFCENIVLWRGHFNATGGEKSVNLSLNGGEAFAGTVWLNDVFLGTAFGNSSDNTNSIAEVNQLYTFPENSVIPGKDNIITIVLDNMGHDETGSGTNAPKSPRGVRGFQLNNGTFGSWKVQGKLGGYMNFPDKVRGILNEGGLFGEREGWHLPGVDTSKWASRDISQGLPDGKAGVGFFVTTFDLNIPEQTDVPLSFVFDGGSNSTVQPYRAILFVNGWMMGKRVANLGPQTKFPVHQGILDYNGKNTVAVALWVMLPNSTVSPTLTLEMDGFLEGGVGGIQINNPSFTALR